MKTDGIDFENSQTLSQLKTIQDQIVISYDFESQNQRHNVTHNLLIGIHHLTSKTNRHNATNKNNSKYDLQSWIHGNSHHIQDRTNYASPLMKNSHLK